MKLKSFAIFYEAGYTPTPGLAPVTRSLKIGRCRMFKDLPTYIYRFTDAINNRSIVSTPTRKNLERLKKAAEESNKVVVFSTIYKVDKSLRGAWSTFIEGTIDGRRFIFSRSETSSRGAGTTSIYVEGKPKMNLGLSLVFFSTTQLADGTYTGVDLTGTRKYALDENLEVLHRLDGPAVEGTNYIGIRNELYYINGVRYEKDVYDKLVSTIPKHTDASERDVLIDVASMFD